MRNKLDTKTYGSLDRQLRRIRRRKLLRRYGWLLFLFAVTIVYHAYQIYTKGPDRWATETADTLQHRWERIEAAFKPDYSTAGEGGYFVTRVVDGDTIYVRDSRGTLKVRLHGIDTPERGQPYGRAAGRALADLVAAEYVRLQEVDIDSYGRVVAKVYIGNTYVNKAMIEKGYAWWYRRYAGNELGLWMAQRRAKKARLGLWAEPDPIPPWEWRRRNR